MPNVEGTTGLGGGVPIKVGDVPIGAGDNPVAFSFYATKNITNRAPTLRETLAAHREQPLCSSCHNRMDPLGLAMENFNALGMWRDTESTVADQRSVPEVAALVAEGLTNRELAERLGISERSAESHLERIRLRLGFRSRAQVAAWWVARADLPICSAAPRLMVSPPPPSRRSRPLDRPWRAACRRARASRFCRPR